MTTTQATKTKTVGIALVYTNQEGGMCSLGCSLGTNASPWAERVDACVGAKSFFVDAIELSSEAANGWQSDEKIEVLR